MINADTLGDLLGRRIHVVGLAGSEGTAVTRFLWERGARDITVHDVEEGEPLRRAFSRSHVGLPKAQRASLWTELSSLPLTRRLGNAYLEGIEDAEVIFAGQAWYLYPRNVAALAPLIDAGLPLRGIMDLYFGLAPARILAVTGSNGKSTTSRLVESMLLQAKLRVWYAGNERRSVQVLDRMDQMSATDWLVLEVSNRHLRGLQLAPGQGADVAVVTNVLPNHLDEHADSFDAYAAVKRRLLDAQPASGFAVLNADDAVTAGFANHAPGHALLFARAAPRRTGSGTPGEVGASDEGHGMSTVDGEDDGAIGIAARETIDGHGDDTGRQAHCAAWLVDGVLHLRASPVGPVERLTLPALPRLPGDHNESNVLAAALASRLAGADLRAIDAGLRAYRGLRHRIQFVWGADDVAYYDDLNATTPQATIAALRALGDRIVLIVGGDDKGLALADLAAEIHKRVVRLVVLPGAGGARIAAAVEALIAKSGSNHDRVVAPAIDRFEDLPPAIRSVVDKARPGQIVLLSPACPYFFRRFYVDGGGERGFRALLREATASSAVAHDAED